MGYYVHLNVCFAADEPLPLAALAQRHLATVTHDVSAEAHAFLDALAECAPIHMGHKGGLCTWGIVGNYTDPERFVKVLRPFWEELLADEDEDNGFPCSHERVLVFYEREQTVAASAYEIGWDNPDSPTRILQIRHFEDLPFSWVRF